MGLLALPRVRALTFCSAILSESTARIVCTIGKTSAWQLESLLRGKRGIMEKRKCLKKNTSGNPPPTIPHQRTPPRKEPSTSTHPMPFPCGSIWLKCKVNDNFRSTILYWTPNPKGSKTENVCLFKAWLETGYISFYLWGISMYFSQN